MRCTAAGATSGYDGQMDHPSQHQQPLSQRRIHPDLTLSSQPSSSFPLSLLPSILPSFLPSLLPSILSSLLPSLLPSFPPSLLSLSNKRLMLTAKTSRHSLPVSSVF